MENVSIEIENLEEENKFRPLPQGKQFHLFISYRDSEEDRQWVVDLINTLENDYKLKCCNHVNDFQPGRKIVDNIKEAVMSSVKTLIILSNSYYDSHWCSYESEFTHQLSMERREKLIIPIVKEDCDVPDHLKPFTYIDGRGPMNAWIQRLVVAIEEQESCAVESKYSKIDFSARYRNLDIVHEEKTKLSLFCQVPFKRRRYIPDGLSDKAFNLTLEQFHEILKMVSPTPVIKHRHCCLPFLPCLFVGVAIFAVCIFFAVITFGYINEFSGNQTVLIKNLKHGQFRDKPDKEIKKYIDKTRSNFKNSAVFFCSIILGSCLWTFGCVLNICRKRHLSATVLKKSNLSLIDKNLLVGLKGNYFKADIRVAFIYFDIKPCMEHLVQIIKTNKTVKDFLYTSRKPGTKKQKVNVDQANQPLLDNEETELKDVIRENSQQEAEIREQSLEKEYWFKNMAQKVLWKVSTEYVNDFLQEKLDKSETNIHSTRAICLCEYAQKHCNAFKTETCHQDSSIEQQTPAINEQSTAEPPFSTDQSVIVV